MNAEFFFNRGVQKSQDRDLVGAIKDYSAAIELSSGVTKKTVSSSLEDGVVEHVNVLESSEGFVNMYYNRACAYLDLGNYEAGIMDLTKVIEYNPEDAEAYFKRAIANYCIQNDDQKDSDLATASRLDPTYNEDLFWSLFK